MPIGSEEPFFLHRETRDFLVVPYRQTDQHEGFWCLEVFAF